MLAEYLDTAIKFEQMAAPEIDTKLSHLRASLYLLRSFLARLQQPP